MTNVTPKGADMTTVTLKGADMSKVILALPFFVLLVSGGPRPADANDGSAMTSSLIHHGEMPPGSTLAFSVTNQGPGGDARRPSCDIVNAILRVAGTLASRTATDGVKVLELLREDRFVLAPGEVHPFEFRQASSSTETVIVQTTTSTGASVSTAPSFSARSTSSPAMTP